MSQISLEPVGRRPKDGRRRQVGILAGETRLQADPQAVFNRDQDVIDFEARLARPEIDGRHLGEQLEFQLRTVAQRAEHRNHVLRLHVHRRVEIDARCDFDLDSRERCAQGGRNGVGIHQESFSFDWSIFRWSWTMP